MKSAENLEIRAKWDEIHKSIGKEVGLNHKQVGLIRTMMIGEGWDRAELTTWVNKKMNSITGKTPNDNAKRHFYRELARFISMAKPDRWEKVLHDYSVS